MAQKLIFIVTSFFERAGVRGCGGGPPCHPTLT
jgi:hypothetical protein